MVDDVFAPHNRVMVDDTGIEPVTPTMSMWCSTAEPIVLRSGELYLQTIVLCQNHLLCAQYLPHRKKFQFELR